MGMRHGVIAATASRDDLLVELSRHAGRFESGGPLASPYDVYDLEEGDGWRLAIGERDGHAFVLDTTMILSDSADMVHAMSAELGLVVAGGAETFSGVHWFTAARDGELLRHVFVDAAGLTDGMAIGQALASEADQPLEGDLDGAGLFAAMASLGLDPRPWLRGGTGHVLHFDAERYPQDGQIAAIRTEHVKRFGRPEGDWLSNITVVAREPEVRP